MDRNKQRQLLDSLQRHLTAIKTVLHELGVQEFDSAISDVSAFYWKEKDDLERAARLVKAQPFFSLEAQSDDIAPILQKCKDKLRTKIECLTDDTGLAETLRPYDKFITFLKNDDITKKLDTMAELRNTLPDPLIYAALQNNIHLAAPDDKTILSPSPDDTVSSASAVDSIDDSGNTATTTGRTDVSSTDNKPDTSMQSADSEPAASIDNGKEATENEISPELRDFFTDAMLLPSEYDFGTLEVSESPKAKKETGVKNMKSDLKKLGPWAPIGARTLAGLNDSNIVTADSVQMYIENYPSHKILKSDLPQEATVILDSLQRNGYLTNYHVTPFGGFYCASHKLTRLFHQKEAAQLLKITYRPMSSNDYDVLEPVAKYADCRLALSRLMNMCHKASSDKLTGVSKSTCLTASMYCANIQLKYKNDRTSKNLFFGTFCNSLNNDDSSALKALSQAANDADNHCDNIILSGMERSQLTALYERLKNDNTYKKLFPATVYYYLLPKDQLFDESWEKTDFNPMQPEPPTDGPACADKEAPVNENGYEQSEAQTVQPPTDPSMSQADIAPASVKAEPADIPAHGSVIQEPADILVHDSVIQEPAKVSATDTLVISGPEPSTDVTIPSDTSSQIKKQETNLEHSDIISKAITAINNGSIPTATAVLRYCSQYYDGWKTGYEQLAYAVDDPAAKLEYSSDVVCNIFAEDLSIFGKYLEVAAACRTFFYDDTEFDHSDHDLYGLVNGTGLLTQPLSDLLYQIMTFKQQHHKGIDYCSDYRMKDQQAVEKELLRLSHDAESYIEAFIEQRENEKKAQKRFIETKKIIFNPDNEIAYFLDVVRNNTIKDKELLEEYMKETFIEKDKPIVVNNISSSKIDRFIDDTWNKAAENLIRVKRNTTLMGSLRNNLISKLRKAAELFCRWLNLAQKSPMDEATEIGISYNRLRNTLLKDLAEAQAQLTLQNKETSPAAEAGKSILRTCLQELASRLDGNYDPDQKRFFYVDFLRSDDLLLDEYYLPDFRHWKHIDNDIAYIDDLLAFAKKDLPSFQQRLKNIFEEAGDNYFTARLIDNYLQATGEGSYIEQQGYDVEENENYAENDCKKEHRKFVENLELAQSYGRLDTANENQKEDILQSVNDCYEYANTSKNFGIFRTVSSYYMDKISEDARKRGELLRKELETCRHQVKDDDDNAGEQKEYLQRIEKTIEKQNYTVTEDLLSRWRDHDIEDDFHFDTTDYLQDFLNEYDFYYNKVKSNNIPLSTLPHGSGHNKEERGASRLAEYWIRGGRTSPTNVKGNARPLSPDTKMKLLLEQLGWNVANVQRGSSTIKNSDTFQVTLQHPSNGRRTNYKHPIAAFGSIAEQEGLRTFSLYGRFDADNLITICKELGYTKNTIIFLDFALQLTERRRLARKIKEKLYGKKAVFLLIDRVVIYYLMRHYDATQINRMLMLITMPFSSFQPYVWESSNVMPSEMFMGRRKELADIESPTGVNIVYGGRQLGKSALLKMAAKDIDHDENNDRAIVVDIKDRDYASAAKLICNVLNEQNFFTQEIPSTNDWDELAHQIRKRLQDETVERIPYFLLMLDEADTFIASCESIGFQPFNALKSIQSIGTGRFKFVIAGLRNIVRFNRDIALGNNSVLPHMKSMTVKPFSVSEARELLETPLYYLGFRFPEGQDTMVSLILASTNYFPGLIQLYCAKLIEAMSNNYAGYDESETPVYEVREEHIKKVLADPGFMDEIKQKFEITLRLGDDNYYYIIALLMAYLYHTNGSPNGYTAADIRQQIMENDITELNGFNVQQIEALMEELRELNVFRKKGDNRYLFNRYSFFTMMGKEDEVISQLYDIMNGGSQ